MKRLALWAAVVCLAGGVAWAGEDPMVGDWKLIPQKSRMIDEMKVASLGGNKYSFDFGGGDPEIAVADGTDQPGHFGITITLEEDWSRAKSMKARKHAPGAPVSCREIKEKARIAPGLDC